MFNSINAWFEAARFGADVQRVVAFRMLRLASGGPGANKEFSRMVAEKLAAFGEAQRSIVASLAAGSSVEVTARKAYAPYRRAVRANRRRLGA
jgi:hypothetical protein